MGYVVRCGEQIGRDYLEKVLELDAIVYEPQYVGELANMQERYDVNPESFVCIINEEDESLVGYINFFPCKDELYRSIRYESDVIRDDDICGAEIEAYRPEENHLFILSVAIHPDYRNSDVVILLTESWIDYLNRIQESGSPVTDILATAVSEDGMKFLRNRMFVQERQLEDGNIVYVCEEAYLDKLLKKNYITKHTGMTST